MKKSVLITHTYKLILAMKISEKFLSDRYVKILSIIFFAHTFINNFHGAKSLQHHTLTFYFLYFQLQGVNKDSYLILETLPQE